MPYRTNNQPTVGVVRVAMRGVLLAMLATSPAFAQQQPIARPLHLRMGFDRTVVSVTTPARAAGPTSAADATVPYPRPRLAGFSPLVAITTSDEESIVDLDYVHQLEFTYVGLPLNAPADLNYVVGVFDSGSTVDLAAGSAADLLGLTGAFLTQNTIGIGGVGGDSILASISQPIAFFAAGLSAIDPLGALDLAAVQGHSNVAVVAMPPITCDGAELAIAIVGTPFLSFFNTIIRVDTPVTVDVRGQSVTSPDVVIQAQGQALPVFSRKVSITFNGFSPFATTASFYPDLSNIDDLNTPGTPTALSASALDFPFGGAFFTTITASMGEPGAITASTNLTMMVDTGAQTSIINPNVLANLNLPLEPDFTVDVCGVGGLVTGVPGYYIDIVTINAAGGAMRFSKAPFVAIALQSPAGGPLDGVLGMNFFWDRNIVFEPSLTLGGFLHVSDPLDVPFGDSDVDFDVDVNDWATFVSCVTGPAATTTISPECVQFDSDGDNDVDLVDFRQLQICFSGSGQTADPTCGP